MEDSTWNEDDSLWNCWSDGTPCGDTSSEINEYFAGRKFHHRKLGHAVVQGYGEYIKDCRNMYAIVFDKCIGIVLVTLVDFHSYEMQTQIDSRSRADFEQFYIRYCLDSPKRHKRDREAYMRMLKFEQENAIHSATK